MTLEQIEHCKDVIRRALEDTDSDLVDAIRRNDGRDGSRENLLAQLDLLEKVKERVNVRYDRLTVHPGGTYTAG